MSIVLSIETLRGFHPIRQQLQGGQCPASPAIQCRMSHALGLHTGQQASAQARRAL